MLRLAADEDDRSRPIRCAWSVLSATMSPIKSSAGISVQPHEILGAPSRFDYIVVIGGLLENIEELPLEYIAFLKRAAARGIPLIGLCTGGFILHRAGLMNGYRCCVSWFHHDDFLSQFEGIVPVSDRIFVIDRDRLTCSGGASAAHLAAWLVERHIGRAAKLKSLHIMMIDEEQDSDNPQPVIPTEFSTRDPLVKKALNLMQQTIESPLKIERLAERLKVGRRKLERSFQEHLRVSPAEANRVIRLTQVRFLLENSPYSITKIASDTGFSDISHLIKTFRDYYGTTPEAYRHPAPAPAAPPDSSI
ncbi:GlxA family transcriptional regulator [Acidocella sp.]|uniref:GlxA family transcriptional regulator n=1 Tax=Acidocella sp. TaxID=50710 RepID=UPI002603D3BF|nr:GlxA family transcriptional regulator [Acidocella sp.]